MPRKSRICKYKERSGYFTVLKAGFRKAEMIHVKRKIQNITRYMRILKHFL